MEWSLILAHAPDLARGFAMTVLCWIVGTTGAMALGLGIELARRFGPRALGWPIRGYVEFIRGTPFLVQLFVLYYGGPLVGLRLEALSAGLIGLTVYGSAYVAEIVRAGMDAVPPGQIEAARAMGFREATVLRRVTLPGALISALPALVNMAIILTKETVILSMITVPEILSATQTMMTETFAFAESILVLALAFWGFVEAISRLGRWMERRVTLHLTDRS